MIQNYDESVKVNHNPSCLYIPDHPYRVLITGDLGSGKTNVFVNLIRHQQPDIGKIHLYVKDPIQSIISYLTMENKK